MQPDCALVSLLLYGSVFSPLSSNRGQGGRMGGRRTCQPLLRPPCSLLCFGQDNLANELVKGPLVTRPGLLSAHLGNSIERLRALSSPAAVCRRWRRKPSDSGSPYIKIITQRNRWPTPGARAHLGLGAAPPPPREGSGPPRGGKVRPVAGAREAGERPSWAGGWSWGTRASAVQPARV